MPAPDQLDPKQKELAEKWQKLFDEMPVYTPKRSVVAKIIESLESPKDVQKT